MEDFEIIDLFFNRSEQAISELSLKYGKVCKKVSLNILNNTRDAEECVNDAYLGAWNGMPPQRPDPLLTYICRIVRNLSIKKYHANTAVKRNSYYDLALDELAEFIPSASTVEAECNSNELAKIIDAFLDTLDRDNRVMFMRRYWFSDPLTEIAKIFNMTDHNVAVRLSRTRKKLQDFLEKEGVSI